MLVALLAKTGGGYAQIWADPSPTEFIGLVCGTVEQTYGFAALCSKFGIFRKTDECTSTDGGHVMAMRI